MTNNMNNQISSSTSSNQPVGNNKRPAEDTPNKDGSLPSTIESTSQTNNSSNNNQSTAKRMKVDENIQPAAIISSSTSTDATTAPIIMAQNERLNVQNPVANGSRSRSTSPTRSIQYQQQQQQQQGGVGSAVGVGNKVAVQTSIQPDSIHVPLKSPTKTAPSQIVVEVKSVDASSNIAATLVTAQEDQGSDSVVAMQVDAEPAVVNTQDQRVDERLKRAQISWCLANLRNLKRHHDIAPFMLPVDPIALGIPTYFDVVKTPMDVSTIDKRLHSDYYSSGAGYIADVQQMLQNCFIFNPANHPVYLMGKNIEKSFNNSLKKYPDTLETLDAVKQKKLQITSQSTAANDEDRRKSIRRTDDMKLMDRIYGELTKPVYQPFMFPFYQPVDPIALNIPSYFDVVKQPMDLSTMKRKMDQGEYEKFEEFEQDFKTMINNCLTFNRPGDDVYAMGQRADELFQNKLRERSQGSSKLPPSVFNARVSSAGSQPGSKKRKSNQDSDDGSSSEEDIQIQMVENQILFLQAQLVTMRKGRRKGKGKSGKRRGSGSKISGVPGVPGLTGSSLMDPMQMQQQSHQSLPKPPREKKVKVPREKKPKKPEEIRKFTFEEKRDLSDDINNLDGDKLTTVVQIIHEGMPQLADAQGEEEIELDIEQLNDETLSRLWHFVKGRRRKQKKPRQPATTDPVMAANRIKELNEQLAIMDGRMDRSKTFGGGAAGGNNNSSSGAVGGNSGGADQTVGSKGVPAQQQHSSTEDSDDDSQGGSDSDLE